MQGLANGCKIRVPEKFWDKEKGPLYSGNLQLRQSTPAEKVAWLNTLADSVRTGVKHILDSTTGQCEAYRVSTTDGVEVLGEKIGSPTLFAVD